MKRETVSVLELSRYRPHLYVKEIDKHVDEILKNIKEKHVGKTGYVYCGSRLECVRVSQKPIFPPPRFFYIKFLFLHQLPRFGAQLTHLLTLIKICQH